MNKQVFLNDGKDPLITKTPPLSVRNGAKFYPWHPRFLGHPAEIENSVKASGAQMLATAPFYG